MSGSRRSPARISIDEVFRWGHASFGGGSWTRTASWELAGTAGSGESVASYYFRLAGH
jgi:hypothetical protein